MPFKRWKCTECQSKVLAFSEDIAKNPINKRNLAWEKNNSHKCIDSCCFVIDDVQPDAVPVHGTTSLMTEDMMLDSVETTHESASRAIQEDADRNEERIVDKQRVKK